MAKTEEMEACPFCGGAAHIGSGPDYAFVNCVDCLASTNLLLATEHQPTEAEAIAAWNTRRPTVPEGLVEAHTPTAYEAGQVLFNTLRAYLGISGVNASKARLIIEFENADDCRKVIEDLRASCSGPARSAAAAGNNSGFWQGVPYTFRPLATLSRSHDSRLADEALRDWWNPDPGDPYWMLEVRQGFDDAGAWLKNMHSFLTTRDAARALRYPSRWAADIARRQLPMAENGRFEPTEHIDMPALRTEGSRHE